MKFWTIDLVWIKKQFGVIMSDIIEESGEIELELKDIIFDKLKLALIDEKRLLKRFNDFCEEYSNFEYDEMGMNMEEGEDVLLRVNKIRDKFLTSIQTNLSYEFINIETFVVTHILAFDINIEENSFRVILEVLEDSFNLEVK